MPDFIQRLKTEVLIDNGEITTDVAGKGFDLTGSFQWWAINHPDIYQDAVKAYFKVGADVASTYTDDTNRLTLKKHGLQDKTSEMNYKMTKITKEVTPNNCYLAFGLQSTDIFLPPMGEATADEVYESYAEQVAIAQDVGVDFFRLIGIDIEQTALALKAIKDNSKLPVLGAFYFNPTPKGFRTTVGIDPTTGAKKLEELGVDVIGIICGSISYEETTAVLREMSAACSKHLAAKPNAGIPKLINGETVYPSTPEEIAEAAPDWVAAGARLIGGCCGTTPEHIAKLVSVLKP